MRYRLTVVGLLAAVAALASSCGDAGGGSSNVLAALSIMDGVGFHTIDEALAKSNPAIDASWLGKTKNARIAVASTSWPKELEPKAKAFVAAAGALQEALEQDNATAAAKPARDAHEAQHDLSADGYALLAKQAGLSHAAGGH